MQRIGLYWHTLRHLQGKQLAYQLYYRLRRPSLRALAPVADHCCFVPGQLVAAIARPVSWSQRTFTFLNQSQTFSANIDWDYAGNGKLWTYNLNYFDYLNQPGLNVEDGLELMRDFLRDLAARSNGLEPYPTSLRIINWIKFLIRHNVAAPDIETSLLAQARHLHRNLEYHLLGNHLLENAFALYAAARTFNDAALYRTAQKLLIAELREQIFDDGGHFERSPMYHQIILDRLLDCINLAQSSNDHALLPFLQERASKMLCWLHQMTFNDGSIPLVNDAANNIAPTSAELFAYAERLGLKVVQVPLDASGYRMIRQPAFELFVDVGAIGPDYIPGHAHSDTFSFLLQHHGQPLIVDTGTSTYESNDRRLLERGTAAHNTVMVNHCEQSEIWGGFRVARRAYVRDLEEGENRICARHSGYERIGASHRRSFVWSDTTVVITDNVTSRDPAEAIAFLHFHPEIHLEQTGEGTFRAGTALITFHHATAATIENYEYAPEFNRRLTAHCLVVRFYRELTTEIQL